MDKMVTTIPGISLRHCDGSSQFADQSICDPKVLVTGVMEHEIMHSSKLA
jgi:hypothetical protein